MNLYNNDFVQNTARYGGVMGFKDTFYTVRINVIRNKFINNTGVEQGGVFYNNQNMNKTIEIYWDGMYEEKKMGKIIYYGMEKMSIQIISRFQGIQRRQ